MTFRKIRKPVTKKIWNWLRFLPTWLRKLIVRSQFEISYDLSRDYIFKLAETEDEVEQALRIVYDSYSYLGYIDQRPEKIHFNAFLCLPTTSILIVKYKNEVIGTMSIVPDSSLGLPSEVTWDLRQLKNETLRIAEVSALTIKRSHKTSKGHLLLTLCKFLYEYCVTTLKVDGVVFAATLEVEPFYTDLLLFRKVVSNTGQEHQPVKGNRSTCCFLDFNKVRAQYIKEYDWRPKNRNLFHFFTEFKSPNIQLPRGASVSLHGLSHKKNASLLKVLRKFPDLNRVLTVQDKIRLSNMDPSFAIDSVINLELNENLRVHPRVSLRSINVYIHHGPTDTMMKAALVDASTGGFGIKSPELHSNGHTNDECIIVFKLEDKSFSIRAQLLWSHSILFGFQVKEESRFEWLKFVRVVFMEVDIPINYQRRSALKRVS